MGNERKNSNANCVVYAIHWGQTVIPMLRIPCIGSVAVYDNDANAFVSGAIAWSAASGRFEFVAT